MPPKASTSRRPESQTTIQSVERASRLLLFAATSEEGVSATEAAERFKLPLPTTYHLLSTLVAEGLLAKDGRRRYTMGPQAAVIANAVGRDQRAPESYLRALRGLADETGETAYLSAWRNGMISVLATVEGAHAVRVAGLETGAVGSEHARASGKLLMAFAEPEARAQLVGGRRLTKRTPNTITSRSTLEREFDTIRRDGYAVDHDEYALGVTCVSAPISEAGLVLAALTVSVPTHRYEPNQAKMVDAVLRSAGRASSAMPEASTD